MKGEIKMLHIYPSKIRRYTILIDLEEIGSFTEISIRNVINDSSEYCTDMQSIDTILQSPGSIKYGHIILKGGLVTSSDFINWLKNSVNGICDNKMMTIQLCSDQNDIIAMWDVINFYPVKYEATELNNKNHEMKIEYIELAHEGIRRIR